MNDFWDSANIIAQDNLPNDLQKEEFYNNLSILLSNYK
jgi:hypothetical protein